MGDCGGVELAVRLRREESTMGATVKRFDERMKQDTGVAGKVELLKIGLHVAVFSGLAPVGSHETYNQAWQCVGKVNGL